MANMAMNAFKPGVVKGMVDLRSGGNLMSAQISSTADAAGLAPGTPVKLVDSGVLGSLPQLIQCAADTDDVFGFIVYDVKSPLFYPGDRCEVLTGRNGIMYMEASAAIARNAEVEILIAGFKVLTAVSTKRIIGKALDKPTTSGNLFRVIVDLPGVLKA